MARINARLCMHKNMHEMLIENGEFAELLGEHYPDQRSSVRDLNNKI